MNRKRLGILLAVLGTLISALAGGYVYVQAQEAEEIARRNPVTPVVMAVADLPERTAILPAAVTLTKVPSGMVPSQSAVALKDVVGKYPLTRVYRNEVVVLSKLADSSGSTGPAFSLKTGMVAVSLAGSDLLTGTGAIRSGDRVDIVLTFPVPPVLPTGSNAPGPAPAQGAVPLSVNPSVTQKLLQNVEVLRVGTFPASGQTAEGQGAKGAITFQVAHQDALVLMWAKDSGGTINLALRHPSDKEPVSTQAINADYVLRNFKFVSLELAQ